MNKDNSMPWPWKGNDEGSVSLLLTGDTNLQNRDDPAEAFQHVLSTLRAAHLLFGHLEGPFRVSSTDPSEPDIPHKLNWTHSDPKMVAGLMAVGYASVSCASNVTSGKGVVESTLETLGGAGIKPCGIGHNLHEARQPAILERKGVRFGFLSYTSVFWPYQHAAGSNSPGVATLKANTAYQSGQRALEMPGAPPIIVTTPDPEELVAMEDDVRKLRKQVDLVVLSCHWGVSSSYEPANYQCIIARKAIDAGADIIIGHHPHVLQPIEVYQGRPIFYSLGNFAFDWEMMRHKHKLGLLVRCLIAKGGIKRVSFVPVCRDENNLITILDPAEEGREILDQVKDASVATGTQLELEDTEIIVKGVGEVE